ncbi:hypothetical protein B0G81_2352 [Paraburkholderia sp. BL6665CI2N2]|nr:hypothetical protein B0G81_2352 [Paraburkholderia sp. BL6665CI2N2]
MLLKNDDQTQTVHDERLKDIDDRILRPAQRNQSAMSEFQHESLSTRLQLSQSVAIGNFCVN